MSVAPLASIALPAHETLDDEEGLRRARKFAAELATRRTVRAFSDRCVPRAVIEACIAAAATAPSGANQQPWRFVAIANAELKQRIREAAEAEEREFYAHRATDEWLAALAPLGTDAEKPFLTTAPWLIACSTSAMRWTAPALSTSATTRMNPPASPPGY